MIMAGFRELNGTSTINEYRTINEYSYSYDQQVRVRVRSTSTINEYEYSTIITQYYFVYARSKYEVLRLQKRVQYEYEFS